MSYAVSVRTFKDFIESLTVWNDMILDATPGFNLYFAMCKALPDLKNIPDGAPCLH
jgi:hypothetical protein